MILNYNEIELFKDYATDLYINEKHYDLHNDFLCHSIIYQFNSLVFKIIFRSRNNNIEITFQFNGVNIIEFKLIHNIEELIIDQIYRGQAMDDQIDSECKISGKGYFYISFIPEFDIEIMADSLIIIEEIK